MLSEVPGARFTVGLSSGGETGYNFSLTSTDPQLLEQTAQQIMTEIRALPSAGAVTSDRSLPRQELTVTPDRLAMADKGVTTQDIATTLRVATVGDYEQIPLVKVLNNHLEKVRKEIAEWTKNRQSVSVPDLHKSAALIVSGRLVLRCSLPMASLGTWCKQLKPYPVCSSCRPLLLLLTKDKPRIWLSYLVAL